MSVAMPATAAAATAAGGASWGGRAASTGAGREGGKLFIQFAGPAMGTFGAAPIGGAHQDLAVLPALFAMKFVNWHGGRITGFEKISSSAGTGLVFSFWGQSLALRA